MGAALRNPEALSCPAYAIAVYGCAEPVALSCDGRARYATRRHLLERGPRLSRSGAVEVG